MDGLKIKQMEASTKYYVYHLQDCVLPVVKMLKYIKRYAKYREVEGKKYATSNSYFLDEYARTLQKMLKEDELVAKNNGA